MNKSYFGLPSPDDLKIFDNLNVIKNIKIQEEVEQETQIVENNEKIGIKKNLQTEGNITRITPYWYRYDKDGNVTSINTGLFVDYLVKNVRAVVANNRFYIYEDGYYKHKTDEEVLGFIQSEIYTRVCNFSVITDIFNQWRINLNVIKRDEELNTDNFILNLENGLYDLETRELKPHTPEVYSTIRINANYKENIEESEGSVFNKYLETSIPNINVRMVVQEMVGYCLTNFTEAQKFFVLNGKTDTGKSVIIKIIEMLIAKENIANKKWQELNGFGVAELYNKILNAAGDLPRKPITDDDLIKELTGEDYVSAKVKFKGDIRFKNKAKLLFSTNGMPKNYGDKSEAFYNRLMIIPFNSQPKKKDPFLIRKLKKEKDYIFMWALEGLERLISNNFKFTECEEVRLEVEAYKEESNTAIQFVNDLCVLNPEKRILKSWLHKEYINYCKEELEVKPMGRNSFYQEILEKYEGQIKEIRVNDQRFFEGITFNKG